MSFSKLRYIKVYIFKQLSSLRNYSLQQVFINVNYGSLYNSEYVLMEIYVVTDMAEFITRNKNRCKKNETWYHGSNI